MFFAHIPDTLREYFRMRRHLISCWLLCFLLLCPLVADAAVFSYGSGTAYATGTTIYPSVVKIDDTHVFLAFYANGGAGRAKIGTVDGRSVTFGSEYEFAAAAQSMDVRLIDSTHALITYATSTSGYAVVATIDDTSITYGTPVTFSSELRTGSRNSTLALLDSTHFVVEYTTRTGEFPDLVTNTKVIAGTISGTTITFGSPTTLTSDDSAHYPYVSALDDTHALLLYGTDDGKGYTRVLSVSGTDITLGTAVEYSTASSDQSSAVLDSTHAIITYRNYVTDNKAYSLVATVSGMGVTLGSATAVTDGTTYFPNTETLSSTTAILIYRDQGDNAQGKARLLTVSGGNVSSDSASIFLDTDSLGQYMDAAALDSSSAFIVSQTDNTAIIATTDTTAPAAPSGFTAAGGESSIPLRWTNPADSDFLSTTIRRSTTAYPATDTAGTAVASGLTGTSVTDSGLAEGMYYYSIFARDLRGNYSVAATASATVSTGSAPSAGGSQGGGGRRGSPGRGGTASVMPENGSAVPGSVTPVRETMVPGMHKRTCDRVMKWFSNDAKMLARVNERLQKRFGFTCAE